jgi:threonine dehydrogenase-like Zn-dependent dehydrogenase
MQALVKETPTPGIALREVQIPEPQAGWAIVKVAACGISGSEIDRFRWTDAYNAGRAKDMTRLLPRIMGHELSGVVSSRARDVTNVAEGTPVVVQPVIGCGACQSCDLGYPNHCDRRTTLGVHADGGFAEYVAVPAANLYPLPPDVSLREIALLQPFAIAAYALAIGRVRAGDRIGIWGVGAIGVSIIQQALFAGARVEFAVGRDRSRLGAVEALGVKHTLSALDGDPASSLSDRFARDPLDVVFEASGHTAAINSALALLKKRGRVVLIGNLKDPFQGDLLPAIMNQQSLLTVRTYSLSAWRRAMRLFAEVRRRGDAIPVEYAALRDGVAAFERAAANPGKKIVLVP